ncbi:MAG: DUF3899 domain-containing protein [Acholeplasmatales bacterium]|jgi:hypothetical protein|nr:DUF3899 domain-containing protein [Acholeplasmatales bacterium]
MNKYLKEFIKGLIAFFTLFVISFLIFWLYYKLDWQLDTVSNSLFIPNILVFIFSLGINLGSGLVFSPFTYTIKLFLQRKKTKEEFASYHDYLERQKQKHVSSWFLTIVSAIFNIVALILALLYMI